MPDDYVQQLQKHDAIYFGAVGWPNVPDHISLWGMMLPLRNSLNQYVNVRPTRVLKGTTVPLAQLQDNPKHLDWVIVRENSEGEYAGQGGTTHGHSDYAIATEVAIFTRVGIERIHRFAFEMAKSRPRKKLTMVTKSNAQRHGMVLWDKIFYEVAKEYDGVVEYDKMLVDAMTVRMVNKPESLDTIVATNCEWGVLLPRQVRLTHCSARRHLVRPSRRTGWQHRHSTIVQSGPHPQEPQHVRADPWLGARYRRARHCQSRGRLLVSGRNGAVAWEWQARPHG